MDNLTFNEDVLKTSCKCKSALIRSPKIEKQNIPADSIGEGGEVEREGGEGEGGGEGDGEGGGEIAYHSDLVFVKYWWH